MNTNRKRTQRCFKEGKRKQVSFLLKLFVFANTKETRKDPPKAETFSKRSRIFIQRLSFSEGDLISANQTPNFKSSARRRFSMDEHILIGANFQDSSFYYRRFGVSGVACFAIYRLLCHLNQWKRIDEQGVRSEHLNNRFFTIGLNGITIDSSQFRSIQERGCSAVNYENFNEKQFYKLARNRLIQLEFIGNKCMEL